MDLKQHIRNVPDFPKPGILFYDISTLLAHPAAWHATVERLTKDYPQILQRTVDSQHDIPRMAPDALIAHVRDYLGTS